MNISFEDQLELTCLFSFCFLFNFRQCFEFLHIALQNWNTHYLEKHIAILQDSIKRGISDADSEARVVARK